LTATLPRAQMVFPLLEYGLFDNHPVLYEFFAREEKFFALFLNQVKIIHKRPAC
jgi:hypothetical protein